MSIYKCLCLSSILLLCESLMRFYSCLPPSFRATCSSMPLYKCILLNVFSPLSYRLIAHKFHPHQLRSSFPLSPKLVLLCVYAQCLYTHFSRRLTSSYCL